MQAEKIWEAALGELQLQVSKANYDTWLKDSRGIAYAKSVFTVAVPSAFIAEWLKGRLHSTVCRILSSITGQNIDVAFQVQEPLPLRPRPNLCRSPTAASASKCGNRREKAAP